MKRYEKFCYKVCDELLKKIYFQSKWWQYFYNSPELLWELLLSKLDHYNPIHSQF